MSLAIRLATSVSPQRLRDLVVDNLTQMLGEGARPWDDMPGLHERIRSVFEPDQMLPAAGQGALGLEIRSDRQDLRAALAPLAHERSWLTVTAERAVSRAMGGSCSMPLAAHGQWSGDQLRLQAAWGDMEGQLPLVRAEGEACVRTLDEADALGLAVAARLRAAGAVAAC